MTPEERSARAKIASLAAAKKRTEKRLTEKAKQATKKTKDYALIRFPGG
jgi:predicted negative regulator of RcsB-dependent stress response